mmetsp:Transcript_5911/g.36655  ORF Transcript_5911/g.36655 Transcript_5911/m.36655 type:complete len:105 (-) Transcript_5911:1072-1386(-)
MVEKLCYKPRYLHSKKKDTDQASNAARLADLLALRPNPADSGGVLGIAASFPFPFGWAAGEVLGDIVSDFVNELCGDPDAPCIELNAFLPLLLIGLEDEVPAVL